MGFGDGWGPLGPGACSAAPEKIIGMTTCTHALAMTMTKGARAGQNVGRQPVLGVRAMCLCAGVRIAWPRKTTL